MRGVVAPFLIALNIFKFPFGYWIYLNAIAPLMGVIHFINRPGVLKLFLPLLAMILLNVIVCLVKSDVGSILRLGQFFSLLCFARFLVEWLDDKKLEKILVYSTSLILITALIEHFFFFSYGEVKDILNFKVHRLQGTVGESNYSAIICAGLFMLSWLRKKWLLCLINICCITLFISKTSFLLCFLFCFSTLIYSKYPLVWRKILSIGFGLLLLTPILVFLFSFFQNSSLFSLIENVTTGRLIIWKVYVDMGLQNMFGVGYMNGWDNMAHYLKPYLELQRSLRAEQVNEQHNLFIHVWSEFGWVGYLLFGAFFSHLVLKARRASIEYFNLLFFIFLGYSFLNGLSDFILYLVLASVLRDIKNNTEVKDLTLFNGRNLIWK